MYAWTPFYSAFSERFALAALELLAASNQEAVLLDPFVGGGTSLVSAFKLGIKAIGIDLDPFSALLSRSRLAVRADPSRVRELLRRPSRAATTVFGSQATELFRPSDLDFASTVFRRILKQLGPEPSAAFAALLRDHEGRFDSEAVALTAVLLGSQSVAKVIRGSNPVWYRKSLPGEKTPRRKLETVSRATASIMLNDLAAVSAATVSQRDIIVRNEDFRQTSIAKGLVDVVLTSPPYLNRMDYVISHLAPLVLMSGFVAIDIDALRKAMIGTTKIVDKTGQPEQSWGSTCLNILEAIKGHTSKDSETYYYWTYLRYFNDMATFVVNLKRLVGSGGRAAVVLQNSFYKELCLPTPEILAEMAAQLDIGSCILRRETIRGHIGTMSPRQLLYVPQKTLEECVVGLEFS